MAYHRHYHYGVVSQWYFYFGVPVELSGLCTGISNSRMFLKFCKFFHGLLQCRGGDINIAANQAFTWDFSLSRGPRHENISTGFQMSRESRAEEFGEVCWDYLRGRVRLDGVCVSARFVKYKMSLLSLLRSYLIIIITAIWANVRKIV